MPRPLARHVHCAHDWLGKPRCCFCGDPSRAALVMQKRWLGTVRVFQPLLGTVWPLLAEKQGAA